MMAPSLQPRLGRKRQPCNDFCFSVLLTLVSVSLLTTTCFATSPAALRVEGRFILLSDTTVSAGQAPPCPETIHFTSILTYRGINPNDDQNTYDGIAWSNLEVNDQACISSRYQSTWTYFEPSQRSPPDTPPDIANPWFLIGYDNSPLRCPTFTAKLPFRYHFTDDLPRFRDRIIRDELLQIGVATNPFRGDIYLFAVGTDRGGDVVATTPCAYRHDGVVESVSSTGGMVSPEPSDEADGGPVCLSARMTVSVLQQTRGGVHFAETPHVRTTRMSDLRIRDVVHTGRTRRDGRFTDAIISFSHYDERKWATFVVLKVRLPSNATRELEVTPGHLVVHGDGATAHASSIRVGDRLLALEDGVRISAPVVHISSVRRQGVYSPVTQSGHVVVNDIIITCYTDAVVDIASAHALLAPVRAGFWIGFGDWCRVIDVFRRALYYYSS